MNSFKQLFCIFLLLICPAVCASEQKTKRSRTTPTMADHNKTKQIKKAPGCPQTMPDVLINLMTDYVGPTSLTIAPSKGRKRAKIDPWMITADNTFIGIQHEPLRYRQFGFQKMIYHVVAQPLASATAQELFSWPSHNGVNFQAAPIAMTIDDQNSIFYVTQLNGINQIKHNRQTGKRRLIGVAKHPGPTDKPYDLKVQGEDLVITGQQFQYSINLETQTSQTLKGPAFVAPKPVEPKLLADGTSVIFEQKKDEQPRLLMFNKSALHAAIKTAFQTIGY